MDIQMIVSPEELYFLGELLHAKYMDYAYIAAMSDSGKSMDLYSREAKQSLVKKGLLREDLSGDLLPDGSVLDVFDPVFFGETETSLDIVTVSEKTDIQTWKFHFLGDSITAVKSQDKMLYAGKISNKEIESIVSDACHGSSVTGSLDAVEFSPESIERILTAKYYRIGEKAITANFLESNRAFFYEASEGKMMIMDPDELLSVVLKIVGGNL